jgi:hypothetical protein
VTGDAKWTRSPRTRARIRRGLGMSLELDLCREEGEEEPPLKEMEKVRELR